MDDAHPPIPYSLASPQIAWRKPIPPHRLRALVATESAPHGNAPVIRLPKQTAARRYLRRILAKGPKPASRIKQDAKARGISKHQLQQARAFYNVVTTRAQTNGSDKKRWCWILPLPIRHSRAGGNPELDYTGPAE